MNIKLNINSKIITIPDVEKVEGMKKFSGLMFRSQKTNAMLFEFNKPCRQAIHSLFCPEFLAVWLDKNKIIEYKFVKSAEFSIKPKAEFTKLIEIPLNNKYSKVTKLFPDGKRKV